MSQFIIKTIQYCINQVSELAFSKVLVCAAQRNDFFSSSRKPEVFLYSYSLKVAWTKSQNILLQCKEKVCLKVKVANHCCLFRQLEWWLAAHTQRANSVVLLPWSRIRLALKAGNLILLVYLKELGVQGWWTHANLTRNWGLNQNVHLLFSNKSCTFQVCWDLPTKALPSLNDYLWESQIIDSCIVSVERIMFTINNICIFSNS